MPEIMSHRILELYSGIGGMHCAWNKSGLLGEVAAAADINTVANDVYRHNFPEILIINRNIQSITIKEIQQLKVDTILMSPPCQPFSRNGKYLDENDPRTKSFLYILSILEHLDCIKYILLENVKGFECSVVRNKFIDTLKKCEFEYQEYLLCPSSMGVPNSRLRYYCLASKLNKNFTTNEEIIEKLAKEYDSPHFLEKIIDHNVGDEFLVPEKLMKRAHIMDICHKESRRSCCVTKSYTHYVEGTGSVLTKRSPEIVETCLKQARTFEKGSPEYNECLKPLNLRFFTPKEVLALMSFPDNYSFPEGITRKQCYRLLGNSVNVKVISELLKLLFS